MTSHARNAVASPRWGLGPTRTRFDVAPRGGRHGSATAGLVLLAAWILLWTFFTVAVVEPAARWHTEAARSVERA